MTSRKHDRRTRTAVAQAYEQAGELGVLHPVEPAMRRSDGSPQVGDGKPTRITSAFPCRLSRNQPHRRSSHPMRPEQGSKTLKEQ